MKGKIVLGLVVFLALVLRLYKLGEVPPSLYWDEASLGYNAYSIAQTLHDEHGELLPSTRFMAFGDYKPPGYIYAAAASIKVFGLSEFAVRFPSALAGTLLVLLTYFLSKELFSKPGVGLLAAFLVAISPWAFHFSHAAFEANLATLFSGLGIYLFLTAVRRSSIWRFVLSAIFLAVAMYAFNSHRVFVPLITVALTAIFYRELLTQWKKFLVFLVLLGVLLFPLARFATTREAQLRFTEVAWINDLAPIATANDRVARDSGVWWSKILHNRRVVFAQEFLSHYTDNFKASFLFYSGDQNQRLSIQSFGEMYWLDLPFLLVGLYFLWRTGRQKSTLVVLAWLLLAPIPAALARETPHALRTLNLLPIPQMIIAVGLVQFRRWRTPLVILYGLFALLYFRDYFTLYPVKNALAWQYGYKQTVEYVATVADRYPCVSVTQAYGRPYIYFLFYNRYDPSKYWGQRQVERDWYGFWTVHSFGKYYFGNAPSPKDGCLFVRAPEEVPKDAKILKTVDDLQGNAAFVIYE